MPNSEYLFSATQVFCIKMANKVQDEQMIQEIQNWVESLEHKISGIIAGIRGNISLFCVDNVISWVAKTAGKEVNMVFSAILDLETETEILLIAM